MIVWIVVTAITFTAIGYEITRKDIKELKQEIEKLKQSWKHEFDEHMDALHELEGLRELFSKSKQLPNGCIMISKTAIEETNTKEFINGRD